MIYKNWVIYLNLTKGKRKNSQKASWGYRFLFHMYFSLGFEQAKHKENKED
jgi:hypothetical protein